MIILDSLKGAAEGLAHPRLKGWSVVVRLEGDSDEAITWHPVKDVSDHMFQGVKALTVAFHDDTPDIVLNETDEVEFAVPRPITGIPGTGA